MKKGKFAQVVALSGASVILSLGLSGLSTPAQAAVTSSNAEQGSVSTLANRCNYPTSARPGSTFVSSWTECTYCHYEELARQAVYPWRDYYCTYNPSNNLNDLHWKA